MAHPVVEFLAHLASRFTGQAPSTPDAVAGRAVPIPTQAPKLAGEAALKAFLTRLQSQVTRYLQERHDIQEQQDHLNHVAARTRWLYTAEQQRLNPNAEITLSARDNDLIEASVFSHDMGKWIPRETLRMLFTDDHAALEPVFEELCFSTDQRELFLLGIHRRFNLAQDGYTPEYDAAHHLVSAYILAIDPALQFHQLTPADQTQIIHMVVGHQFGSYFKGSLLNLSLHDREVTTGMLIDTARSDRLAGDVLSSVFHDADISDLLYVGALENLANGEEKLHGGGLVKILMINFTNLLHQAPQAPANLDEVLQSCLATVNNACKEFLTATATACGPTWREPARLFLDFLQVAERQEEINHLLRQEEKTAAERLAAIRTTLYTYATCFLKDTEGS